MTPFQLMIALQKVTNVADFCRRHDLPDRTVYRLQRKAIRGEDVNGGHKPQAGTKARIIAALKKDGVVSDVKKQARGTRR
jgi:hypothetical protein